jgi:hypothetical protein
MYAVTARKCSTKAIAQSRPGEEKFPLPLVGRPLPSILPLISRNIIYLFGRNVENFNKIVVEANFVEN